MLNNYMQAPHVRSQLPSFLSKRVSHPWLLWWPYFFINVYFPLVFHFLTYAFCVYKVTPITNVCLCLFVQSGRGLLFIFIFYFQECLGTNLTNIENPVICNSTLFPSPVCLGKAEEGIFFAKCYLDVCVGGVVTNFD